MTATAAPNIIARFGDNRVTVRWLPTPLAASYRLYVGAATAPTTLQTTIPSTAIGADGWLSVDFTHNFPNAFCRLTAVNGSGEESAYSNEEEQFVVGSVLFLSPSGVADNVALQAAINTMSAYGGRIVMLPGSYACASGIVITPNVRLRIEAYGATLLLATGVTGITINQGVAQAKGVRIEGLGIDGQSNASTIGLLLKDTNNSEALGMEIDNCATGIQLDSNLSGKFVEGTLLDNIVLRGNTVGIDFTVAAGTGSFMQTIIRGLKCVVGGTGIGMRLNSPGVLMRSYIQAQFWIDTGQTGVILDGDINQSHFALTFEGAGGATGNVGLSVGANALNTTASFFDLNWTGTVATQLTTTKDMHYMKGSAALLQLTGTSTWGYRRHGDTTDRIRFEGLAAGGKISLGSGSVIDVTLARSAVGVLAVGAHLQPTNIKLQVKAGIPVDGDVVNGVADGDCIVDTTNNKIMVRIGGTWKGVVVA